MVGRNYTYQLVHTPAMGVFEGRQLSSYMGNGATRHIIYDFQADLVRPLRPGLHRRGVPVVRGGGARPGRRRRGHPKQEDPDAEEDDERLWGQQFRESMRDHWDAHVGIGIHGESMAFEDSFCDLDPNYTDALGLPLLRITYDFQPVDYNM